MPPPDLRGRRTKLLNPEFIEGISPMRDIITKQNPIASGEIIKAEVSRLVRKLAEKPLIKIIGKI